MTDPAAILMEPRSVDGLDFTERHAKYGSVRFSAGHVLKLDEFHPGKHPNKLHSLAEEVRILADLTMRGAACAPRLRAHGSLDGRPYLIVERVREAGQAPQIEVLRAFRELMSFGYLHGDLKPENAIWDGTAAVLIDFDQTVHDASIASMTIAEACDWADARKDDLPWRQCGSLRDQLQRFGYPSNAGDPRLDLVEYPPR
jgi:hypothetical protein